MEKKTLLQGLRADILCTAVISVPRFKPQADRQNAAGWELGGLSGTGLVCGRRNPPLPVQPTSKQSPACSPQRSPAPQHTCFCLSCCKAPHLPSSHPPAVPAAPSLSPGPAHQRMLFPKRNTLLSAQECSDTRAAVLASLKVEKASKITESSLALPKFMAKPC